MIVLKHIKSSCKLPSVSRGSMMTTAMWVGLHVIVPFKAIHLPSAGSLTAQASQSASESKTKYKAI